MLLNARIPWLLRDIPGERPGSEMALNYVLEGQRRGLRKDDRSVGEFETSEIWNEYARRLVRTAGKVRVFCHPEFVDSVEATVRWRVGVPDLVAAIEAVSGTR